MYDPALVRAFHEAGWWRSAPLRADIEAHDAHAIAFTSATASLTWGEYRCRARDLARALTAVGARCGDRVAVLLPDAIAVHVAYLAAEYAGVCVVGIARRSGEAEVRRLLERTGAVALVSDGTRGGYGLPEIVLDARGGTSARRGPPPEGPGLGPDDLFLINSTSGTTGLPKCVTHTQNRWLYFASLAIDAGRLGADDVFASVVPAPYGFGLWSAHFVPALLGRPCVVTEHFDVVATLDLLARERVTVLAAVTTQLLMLLDEIEAGRGTWDLSALRCVFTGGERVPYERMLAFEDRVGASVLQFYGANESGAISHTTLEDPREMRLRTAGRIVPQMRVRLFDQDGEETTGTGVPGCLGPAMGPGYWDDPEADARLFRADGWQLMGDLVRVDAQGWLTVVGRVSDFIVRGGKNISAPAVEEQIASHPAVAQVAVVAAPDARLGERACAYVVPLPGHSLELVELTRHLAALQVTREWWPEHLVCVDALPYSPGGKVAKQHLREDAARRFGAGPPQEAGTLAG